ncbi:anti-sigma factor [Amycolatopsis arida]|nr:anti-sigma factor [Amycolatopsis arida]
MTVRTRADAEVIPTLRTIGADLAMRLDFDLDAVDDLRMAVDEACSMLLPSAVDGVLTCEYRWAKGRVQVAVEVVVSTPDRVAGDGLGWQLLTALATSVDRTLTPVDGGHRARVELVRECATVAR